MQPEAELDELIRTARSLFSRGYSFGTAGNLSIRAGSTLYATPTGCSFETVTARSIAICDLEGRVSGSNVPTKELPFHLAAYRARPGSGAVVHLHSAFATALSCLEQLDLEDALPPLTPYYAMRIPHLPVVPYFPPGDRRLGDAVEQLARSTPALLMRNHGSIAIGETLAQAAALAEEIEETARLFFILGNRARPLSREEANGLRRRPS